MDAIILSPQTSVADIVAHYPQAIPVFLRYHMSCVGCSMSIFETVHDAARIYDIKLDTFLAELHQAVACESETSPAASPAPAVPHNPFKEPTMSETYTFFPAITGAIDSIPQESIVSRTIYRDDHLKAILFAFAPGQELSEHTASVPAIIQIVEGEGELTLGDDRYQVTAGAWARMPANLKHSIVAQTPVKMLLLMLP